MENIYDRIQESTQFIQSKCEVKPQIGLILGYISKTTYSVLTITE